jgi:hypothetical protein
VRSEERARAIDDDHSSFVQDPQLVQPWFGTCQRRQDVEAAESYIASTESARRMLGREDERIEAER